MFTTEKLILKEVLYRRESLGIVEMFDEIVSLKSDEDDSFIMKPKIIIEFSWLHN